MVDKLWLSLKMPKTKSISKNGLKIKKVKKKEKSIQRKCKCQKEKPTRRPKIKAVQKPKRTEKAGNANVLRKLQFMASQNARKGY